jgi:thiosulfate/3-mercaptopyruvate sulfurtransferase
MRYIVTARKIFTTFAAVCVVTSATKVAFAATKPASSLSAASLIQPAELAAMVKESSSQRPLMLHVGFRTMFDQAHIPDSEYAGPGNTEAGLQVIRDRVAKLAKDTAIVVYCGCCPWIRCPNVAAAHDTLQELGFTRVKVMYIADNLGSDWVEKGYPTAKSK